MEVILLERIEKLGQMGDVVNVKTGLHETICYRKIRPFEKQTKFKRFESQRAQLEADNLTRKNDAEKLRISWKI